MKSFYLSAFFIAITQISFSQNVAINDNGSAPHASAMLDVNVYGATKRGLLVPRMTTAERNSIVSPATGLLVFDINDNSFYVYASSAWRQMVHNNNNLWYSSGGATFNTLLQPVNITNSGIAVEGQLNAAKESSSTTGVETVLSLQRLSSGTPTDGIGGALMFRNQSTSGGLLQTSRISSIIETFAAGVNRGAMKIDVYNNTGSIPQMYINPDGVSIGSSSLPQGKLHVYTDGSLAGGLRISNTTPATYGPTIYFKGATQDWTITATNAGAGAGTDKLVFRNYSTATDHMVIDASGNVGIGITSPGAGNKLDVAGAINFAGTLKVNGSSGNAGDVLVSNGASDPQWVSHKIGFRAQLSGTTTILNNSYTNLTSFTELYDDGNAFNPLTGEYTIPASGLYSFNTSIAFSSVPVMTDAPVQVRIYKNGSTFAGCQLNSVISTVSGYGNCLHFVTETKCNAGDIITIAVMQNSGASHDLIGAGASSTTTFAAHKAY